MNNELVVIDEDLREEGENAVRNAKALENSLNEMIAFLDKVGTAGIASGNASANFSVIVNEIKRLKGEFESIGKEEQILVEQFINNVDSADGYLY